MHAEIDSSLSDLMEVFHKGAGLEVRMPSSLNLLDLRYPYLVLLCLHRHPLALHSRCVQIERAHGVIAHYRLLSMPVDPRSWLAQGQETIARGRRFYTCTVFEETVSDKQHA